MLSLGLSASISSKVGGAPEAAGSPGVGGTYTNNYTLRTDGVSDAIITGMSDAQTTAMFTNANGLTISVWMKTDDWSAYSQSTIIGFNDGDRNEFDMKYISSPSFGLDAEWNNAGPLNGVTGTFSPAPSDNVLTFLCFVIQPNFGSNGITRIQAFVDGVYKGFFFYTAPSGSAYSNYQSASLTSGIRYTLGARMVSATPTFNNYGSAGFSDLAFHTKQLSSSTIAAMYNSGNPKDLRVDAGSYNDSSSLAYYYLMENSYIDILGNGGDLTTEGSPTFVTI
jgi:hypothetical protein